jgi:hypothetical protein
VDRLDRLEQVVSNLNEAVKELQTEVKKLKGEGKAQERLRKWCDAKIIEKETV